MGMQAELIAIGKFSDAVKEHLEYSARYYDNVQVGTMVITRLFCQEGSTSSEELAECFLVDPWDFESHHINVDAIDWLGLSKFVAERGQIDDLEALKALVRNGFDIYYMPNG